MASKVFKRSWSHLRPPAASQKTPPSSLLPQSLLVSPSHSTHWHALIRSLGNTLLAARVSRLDPPAPPVAAAAAAAQRQTVTECLTPAQSGGGRSPWVPWDSTSSVPLVQCLKVRRDPAQTRGTRTLDSLIQTS